MAWCFANLGLPNTPSLTISIFVRKLSGVMREFLQAWVPALRICPARAERGDVIVVETDGSIQGVA